MSGRTEAELEAAIDRAVMRRLRTDSAYRNAASAEEQAAREAAITREEERLLTTHDPHRRRLEELDAPGERLARDLGRLLP